jgi:hypothetical protein
MIKSFSMGKTIILQLLVTLISCSVFSQNTAWSTEGNTGLPASAFLGTADLAPLIFKVDNQLAGFLDPTSDNTSFGFKSLFVNSTGYGNTGFGMGSLYSNTTGSANTAVGVGALQVNASGSYNVALGGFALSQNIDGINNVAVGNATLLTSTGSQNTAVGTAALLFSTTASENTAIGNMAAFHTTTGSANTFIGSSAAFSITTGSANTSIGSSASPNNMTGTYNVAIGSGSGTSSSFNNTISIGNHGWMNGYHNQAFIGNANTAWIGGWTTWRVYSDARIKTKITEEVKGLDFITRLRPVTYFRNIKAANNISGNKEKADYPEKYDAEKMQTSGFLAQEVEQAAKEAGYNFDGVTRPRSNTDLYSLSYESFVVPLVKAMQEQQAMINRQQDQIATLERKMAAILGSKTGEIMPHFQLTPNPSGEFSMLSCDDRNVTINSLILYNNAGVAVWSQKTAGGAGNPIRIGTQHLSSGVYYLNIQTAGGWHSIKLAKQ